MFELGPSCFSLGGRGLVDKLVASTLNQKGTSRGCVSSSLLT